MTNKIYKFNWIDEEGNYCGWNKEVATSMAQARKQARKRQSPAKDITYDVRVNGRIEQRTERFKGMYIDPKSFKNISSAKSIEINSLANMMCR